MTCSLAICEPFHEKVMPDVIEVSEKKKDEKEKNPIKFSDHSPIIRF